MGISLQLAWTCLPKLFLAVPLLAAPAVAPSKPAAAKPPAKAPAPKPDPVQEAKALRAAGKLDQALEVLRYANREIKKVEGEESPQLLAVNNLAADILLDQGQFDVAESLVEKTMALHEALVKAEKVGPDTLGPTFLLAARIDMQAKRFLAAIDKAAEAMPLLEKTEGPRGEGVALGSDVLETSAESLEKLLGPADTMTSDSRVKAADVFERLGRFDQAIAQRKGILAGVSARGEAAAIENAAERLGRLMGLAGRAAEAIPILESAPSSSGARLRLLGDLRLAANQLLAAHGSFKAAMGVETKNTKPSPFILADDRLRQLLVDIRRGKVHAVPEWFSTTVTPLEKSSSTEAVRGLVAASEAVQAFGNQAETTRLLTVATANARKQAAASKKGSRAPPKAKPAPAATGAQAAKTARGGKPTPPIKQGTTPLLAEVVSRLAAAHLAVGEHAKAHELAKTEIESATEAFGPGHGLVSLLRVMAAGGASGQGDLETATTLASEALSYGLPRPDDGWEETLVTVFDTLPPTDIHPDWRTEFLDARVRQYGETHPHVATAWSFFGAARLAAGDWPAATKCYSKALEIQRATLGENHPEVAASLAMLAHTQRAGGDASDAAQTAAKAVAMLEQTVGLNHPATLEAVDVLVAAQLESGARDGVAELLQRLCTADAMGFSVRHAYHLTRLAEVMARKDQAAARSRVQSAMALSCWKPDEALSTLQRRQLADTAAYAARVYRMLGDAAAAQTTLLKARSLALRLDESGSLIDRMERLATPEP